MKMKRMKKIFFVFALMICLLNSGQFANADLVDSSSIYIYIDHDFYEGYDNVFVFLYDVESGDIKVEEFPVGNHFWIKQSSGSLDFSKIDYMVFFATNSEKQHNVNPDHWYLDWIKFDDYLSGAGNNGNFRMDPNVWFGGSAGWDSTIIKVYKIWKNGNIQLYADSPNYENTIKDYHSQNLHAQYKYVYMDTNWRIHTKYYNYYYKDIYGELFNVQKDLYNTGLIDSINGKSYKWVSPSTPQIGVPLSFTVCSGSAYTPSWGVKDTIKTVLL
ncbi:MAG: hypothetical protein ACTSVU_01930 [Promethearchaeota archaeon]